MSNRNYIQIAMMKRYGKTQTVFQDRRTKRSGEKIDWLVEAGYNEGYDGYDDFESEEFNEYQ